jgi:peptidoglycan hydrolase CwlO-like protein
MFQSIFSNSNSNSPSHNNNHNTNKSKSTQTTFPQELHKQRRHIEKIQSLIQESKSLVISPQTTVTILEQWITKQEELRNKLHDTYYSLRVMNLTGTQRLQV